MGRIRVRDRIRVRSRIIIRVKKVFVFDSKSQNRDRAVEAVESVSEA